MSEPTQPTIIHFELDALRKLFSEVKSSDYTRAQFEHDKTERIKALSATLAAVGSITPPGYSTEVAPRQAILERIKAVCDEQYSEDVRRIFERV